MLSGLKRFKHYILFYNYVEGIVSKREPFLADHRNHCYSYVEKGLRLSGPLSEPLDGAMLLFEAEKAAIEDFAKNDPFYKNNLIASYEIKEFTPIINAFTK